MFATTSLLTLAALFPFRSQRPNTPGVDKVADKLKQGGLVLDVRSPAEFAAQHLPEAVNVPLDLLPVLAPEHLTDKNRPLLIHCHAGVRSASAKTLLERMGYTQLVDLGSYPQAEALLKAARA